MDDQNELDLREYVRILWRHKVAIIASVLICTSVAMLLSARQDKVYEATAQVLLTSASDAIGGSAAVDATQIATEIAVMESAPIRALVDEELGADAALISSTSAARVGLTRVIEVRARSGVPEVAQEAANATADTYVAQRLDRTLATLNNLREETQRRVEETRDDIEGVDEEIAQELSKESPSETVLDSLTTRREALTAQLLSLQQRLGDLQIDSELSQAGAEVLSPAGLPSSPASPKPRRDGVLGALLGLIIGVGIALAREVLAGRANREDDIVRVLPSAPVLARVPVVDAVDIRRGEEAVFAIDAPASQGAEALRLLNVNLQFTHLDQPLRSLMVTSASSSEGKTTIAANLAATVARTGKNVVLVDCDLRRPGIHPLFGLPNDVGLTTVLLGRAKLENAMQVVPVEGFRALHLLTAGVPAPNPAELLGSKQLNDLVQKLTANADLVIIDVPPVVPVADALMLSQHVDGVLLVARLGTSKPKALAQADSLLRRAGANVVGLVLNGVNAVNEPYFVPEVRAGRKDRWSRRAAK